MTATVLLVCLLLGAASAVVDLRCSENPACLERVATEVVRNLKQQRAVRIFDGLTIEPIERRQGRAREGFWSLIENNAVSFDWSDFTFKVSLPEGKDDALDLEMYESRTVTEKVAEAADKKSSSKVEEEKEEIKAPKLNLKRRHKKKVFQALIPLLFGMKSAGAVIFAFAVVAALTIKAFVASKLALLVTIGMAAKRLYESYSAGVGLQNHPYLYSQYPIDFPGASSHAYSASGVSPQFASQEMFTPTGMGAQTLTHDILQTQDARAQQSQQVPTQILLNSTIAEQRWDGKSVILKYLEPIISRVKNAISPITNALFGATPTVRGLTSDASTVKNVEVDPVIEVESKPKEFLVPQPRFIRAQRKNFETTRTAPKKQTEIKIDLDRLKHNKDLYDYMKTKKYNYNYPTTYFYPRVKYIVHPTYYLKPNNSRLIPYKIQHTTTDAPKIDLSFSDSDWKPVLILNTTNELQNDTKITEPKVKKGHGRKALRRFMRRKSNLKRQKRIKRDLSYASNSNKIIKISNSRSDNSFIDFIPIFSTIIGKAKSFAKPYKEDEIKHSRDTPFYDIYEGFVAGVDVLHGMIGVGQEMFDEYEKQVKTKTIKKHKLQKSKSNNCSKLKNELDYCLQRKINRVPKTLPSNNRKYEKNPKQ